jgi:hypothetical protein
MGAKPLSTISMTALCLAATLTAGCATPPPRADDIARTAGFTRAVMPGAGFRHITYRSMAGPADAPVWIYIEGDGIPWVTDFIPAADPTPHTFVALEAMAAGGRPALYVGRPCYFEANRDPGCETVMWTHRRFAPEVVASMAGAIQASLDAERLDGRPLILVGFSGGGTLATLLAPELPHICALITMASPLDLDAWTREHDYSPMTGSLNPATVLSPLPSGIRQLHLRSRRDHVVAADNAASWLSRQPHAELRVFDSVDHGAGWLRVWRELLGTDGALPVSHCRGGWPG